MTWEARFADSLGKTEQAIERLRTSLMVLGDEPEHLSSDTELHRAAGYLHLTFAHLLRHTDRALADEHFANSVTIFVELNDRWGLSQAYLGQSAMAREYGDYRLAEVLANRCLEIVKQLEDVRTIAEVQGRLGLIYMDLGELGAASGFFTQVLESYRALGETLKVANALEFLGLLALYQGTNHVACQQDELGQAHGYLAYVDLAQDNRQGAQTHIVQALQQASVTRTILPILLALSAAARLFVVQEEPEMAGEMWAQATAYPMIANSAMMEALSGGFVQPFFESLPQSAVDAAKERGSQRDLHEAAEYLLSRLTS